MFYINDVVIKNIMYRLIAKDNRVAHCICVVSSTQSIFMSLTLNYRKSRKSDYANRNMFIYKYTSLIIIDHKYILAIEKTKRI